MIFKSPYPDIEIPVKGVYQYVTSNPYGISDDKVIFTDGTTDKKLTFGTLKSNSKKFAAGLIDKAGFKRGDVLAIFSPNQVREIRSWRSYYIVNKKFKNRFCNFLDRLSNRFTWSNCSRRDSDIC